MHPLRDCTKFFVTAAELRRFTDSPPTVTQNATASLCHTINDPLSQPRLDNGVLADSSLRPDLISPPATMIARHNASGSVWQTIPRMSLPKTLHPERVCPSAT